MINEPATTTDQVRIKLYAPGSAFVITGQNGAAGDSGLQLTTAADTDDILGTGFQTNTLTDSEHTLSLNTLCWGELARGIRDVANTFASANDFWFSVAIADDGTYFGKVINKGFNLENVGQTRAMVSGDLPGAGLVFVGNEEAFSIAAGGAGDTTLSDKPSGFTVTEDKQVLGVFIDDAGTGNSGTDMVVAGASLESTAFKIVPGYHQVDDAPADFTKLTTKAATTGTITGYVVYGVKDGK